MDTTGTKELKQNTTSASGNASYLGGVYMIMIFDLMVALDEKLRNHPVLFSRHFTKKKKKKKN